MDRFPRPRMIRAKRAGLALLGLLLCLSNCAIIPTPPPAPAPASPLPVPSQVSGGPSYAHVLFVRVEEESGGTWRLDVTVQHEDEGEAHYADRWEVLIPLPNGQTERYTRELTHPHVEEQPFTRSLAGVEIPDGVTRFTVRAHDSQDGYGGQEVTVDLEVASGPGFQVVRK